MTPDEFRALVARHKGLAGHKIVDPTVKRKDRFGDDEEVGNPTPQVRYQFKDGTHLVARQDPESTNYEVVDGGTALTKDEKDAPDARKPQIVNVGGGKIGVASVDEAGKGSYTPIDTGPGPMVQRPTGRTQTSEGRTTPVTESVTKEQADYDRQVAGDQRQAAIDLQNRLQQAEQNARQAALDRIASDRWTAEQANTEYNKSLDKIRLEAAAEVNRITQRGQDITVRGQDISAGVSQRGQDLGYEQSLAQNSTSLATAMLPYMNAPGQIQSTNSLMGGGPPVPTQPMGMPFDPATFPAQAAMNARNQMPGQFQLPGAPPQVQAGNYRLPG